MFACSSLVVSVSRSKAKMPALRQRARHHVQPLRRVDDQRVRAVVGVVSMVGGRGIVGGHRASGQRVSPSSRQRLQRRLLKEAQLRRRRCARGVARRGRLAAARVGEATTMAVRAGAGRWRATGALAVPHRRRARQTVHQAVKLQLAEQAQHRSGS